MSELPITVCRVETNEGPKDYLTCLPYETVFAHGLPTEAIVGVLLRPLQEHESISPATFARNRTFVDFLHSIIARHGPSVPGLIAEARRQEEGWVYVIDQRTCDPDGGVPPEDILGGFEVKQGKVVAGSYQACPKHMILSKDGFVRLDAELRARLLEELTALATDNRPS